MIIIILQLYLLEKIKTNSITHKNKIINNFNLETKYKLKYNSVCMYPIQLLLDTLLTLEVLNVITITLILL
jgi:hypothetical protein